MRLPKIVTITVRHSLFSSIRSIRSIKHVNKPFLISTFLLIINSSFFNYYFFCYLRYNSINLFSIVYITGLVPPKKCKIDYV